MTQATLFVCELCRFPQSEGCHKEISGGQYFIDQLQTELDQRHLLEAVCIQPVRCMAQCDQPCNVTLAAPGKLTFILTQMSATESAPALAEFCQQYTTCVTGKVPYRSRSQTIHQATAFILPPLPTSS